MHPGQQQFFDFFYERAAEDQKETAKSLLEECFEMQNSGTFSMERMSEMVPKMLATLKPEHLAEVTDIMNNFGKDHVSK